jgi:pimeloyl-ACP methyl ester carboxylesterase
MHAAADVERLAGADGPLAAAPPIRSVVGHSFGGKVALALAAGLSGTLDHVWVIDSTPETRDPDGTAWKMLALVRSLPPRFASRADAVASLVAAGLSIAVANWMATNLRHTDAGFVWTLDFDAMEALLRDFFATDLWAIVEAPPAGLHVHVVKGTRSGTISPGAVGRLDAAARATGRVHLHHMEGGHWLHTENPGALIALIGRHL